MENHEHILIRGYLWYDKMALRVYKSKKVGIHWSRGWLHNGKKEKWDMVFGIKMQLCLFKKKIKGSKHDGVRINKWHEAELSCCNRQDPVDTAMGGTQRILEQ